MGLGRGRPNRLRRGVREILPDEKMNCSKDCLDCRENVESLEGRNKLESLGCVNKLESVEYRDELESLECGKNLEGLRWRQFHICCQD